MSDEPPTSSPPTDDAPLGDAPPEAEQPDRSDPTLQRETDATIDRLLERAERVPVPSPDARRRMDERVRSEAPEKTGQGLGQVIVAFGLRRGLLVASATVVAMAAAVILMAGGIWRAVGQTVHRNEGPGAISVTLDDGSKLIVDHGAEVVERSGRRLELVRGRVLLDAVHGAEPFVVESRHGKAVVLGTRFVVEASESETRASVIRGRVQLEAESGRELLRAGEQGVLRDGAAPVRSRARRLSYLASWAREAMATSRATTDQAVRRGTLLARAPGWDREWPLEMRELSVDVHVEDGVVRTTIDQTFFNHVNRRLEGRYSFPLPPDAAISRLAMYVDGRRMEGGIVERQRGRDVYESIVYLRRDPALLEQMAGNTFRIRIFPLEPRAEKRIVLSYTQSLPRLYDGYRLAVPIPEIDKPVKRVSFRVLVKGGEGYDIVSTSHPVEIESQGADRIAAFAATDRTIGTDLVLQLRDQEAPSSKVTRFDDSSGSYLLARLQPELSEVPASAEPRRWVVLFDTSASRRPSEIEAQSVVLGRLLREWDEEDRLAVLAFDTTVRRWGGWHRVADADVHDLRSFLDAEAAEPLGTTSLERGLDAALELLAERQADDEAEAAGRPHILYIGDGIVTGGERTLEGLSKKLHERATFVAVAVGDRIDATMLRGLAEGTGGLYTRVNPADDLGWRAFDLVAALNTPRILSLDAELLDEQGAPIEGAQAYLSSAQLAEGEDAVALARLEPGQAADKLRLSGTLAGEAWSAELPLSAAAGEASYLPRLWARHRIEALLGQGAAAHGEEITALGLKHFLVTPFTSLLVLETEEMYRQFQVSRPSDSSWARYSAPETIEVKTEPLGSEPLALGAEGSAIIMRTPLTILTAPSRRVRMGGIASATGWSGLGLGTVGTIGAGGGGRGNQRLGRGTGQGFGSGHGRLGRSHRARRERGKSAGAPPVPHRVVTTGALREEVSTNEWRVPVQNLGNVGPNTDEPLSLPQASASSAPAAGPTAVGAPEVDRVSVRSAHTQALGSDPKASAGLWPVPLHGLEGAAAASVLVPGAGFEVRALRHSRDRRLDDLTEFVPALLGDAVDLDRDWVLGALAAGQQGSVAVGVREILDKALGKQRAHRYELPDGSHIETRADGAFEIERTAPTGLRERLVFDGETLLAFYPELELAVRRPVAPGAPALLARYAPFVVPAPAQIERAYVVTESTQGTLHLTPVGGTDAASSPLEEIHLELDDELHVTRVQRQRPDQAPVELLLERKDGRLTALVSGGKRLPVTSAKAGQAGFATDVPQGWVVVEMPMRDPGHWDKQVASAKPGSAPWREAQAQLLATQAALGNVGEMSKLLGALREHAGGLRRGELALGSRAAAQSPDRDGLDELLEGLEKLDPVASYVRAAWSLHDKDTTRALSALTEAEDGSSGLVPMLAAYRVVLHKVDRGPFRPALEAYQAFVATAPYDPLRLVAALQLTDRFRWEHAEDLVKLWDEIAQDPELRLIASFTAAELARRLDQEDLPAGQDAATRTMGALDAALAQGIYPVLDWSTQRALQGGGGGNAAWRLFWVRWRTKLLKAKDPRALLALAESMQRLGQHDELDAVVAALRQQKVTDPDIAAALAGYLVQLNRPSDARRLLEPLLEGPGATKLLELAAIAAEREGDLPSAVRHLDHFITNCDEPLTLDRLRSLFARLFDLQLRAAHWDTKDSRRRTDDGAAAAADDGADDRPPAVGLDGALRTAARWRRFDPDNAAIDKRCAAALYSADKPEQAWRHLSSIAERHPAEGQAYADVAQVLENQGRLAEAVPVWKEGSQVEPTNPTWLLREAQVRLALGQTEESRQLLERITAGTWQERFSQVADEARALRKATKR